MVTLYIYADTLPDWFRTHQFCNVKAAGKGRFEWANPHLDYCATILLSGDPQCLRNSIVSAACDYPAFHRRVMTRVAMIAQKDTHPGVTTETLRGCKQCVADHSWLAAYGKKAVAAHKDRDALLAYLGADAQPWAPSDADTGSLITGWHAWEDPDLLHWIVHTHALKHVNFASYQKYEIPSGINKQIVRVVVHANLDRIYLFNDGLYFHAERVGEQLTAMIDLLGNDDDADLKQVGQGLARLQQEIADHYQNKTA